MKHINNLSQSDFPVSTLKSVITDTETRLLAAAKQLFLVHGFSAVSGDRLCKEARVSKTSLYKYYGDMAGVLAAVVVSERDLFELAVESEPSSEQGFWWALFDYGVKVINVLNDPSCVELARIMHEEARSNPELAEKFYESSEKRCLVEVGSLIAFGQQNGYVNNEASAMELADHLISMWQGTSYSRARLGLTKKPFKSPEDWVKKCIVCLYSEARVLL